MSSTKLQFLLALSCLTLVGCKDRTKVGDYEFVEYRSLIIDSGAPRPSLYYQGKKVCECVLMGSEQTYRDGILVFMSKVPDKDGGLNLYPQLFAIRGEGPPIILSERILDQPLQAPGGSYELENLDTPSTNGVRAIFKLLGDVMVTNNILWSEIRSDVQEAEASAAIHVAPLGSYRILAMKRPDNVLEPTAIAP